MPRSGARRRRRTTPSLRTPRTITKDAEGRQLHLANRLTKPSRRLDGQGLAFRAERACRASRHRGRALRRLRRGHPLSRAHRSAACSIRSRHHGRRRAHAIEDRLGAGRMVPGAACAWHGARARGQFRQRQRLHRQARPRDGEADGRSRGGSGRLPRGRRLSRLDRGDRRAARPGQIHRPARRGLPRTPSRKGSSRRRARS